MYRDMKFRRRVVVQAASEGNLNKLKEIYDKNSDELSYIDRSLMDDALFYSIRSCNIECVEYLLNNNISSLGNLKGKNLVWEIVNKRGLKQNKRIAMFRFLCDNGNKDIAYHVVDKYIQLRRKDYFKMALEEFSKEIDLNKIFKDYSQGMAMDRREEFLAEISKELRSEKIDNLLK